MYLPGLYTDPFEEYWHLINHVTLWDVSVERQVEISGKDGAKFAELITPRDLTKCDVGQGKYVVITDENGGIINDPVLIRLEKNRFWLSLANSDTLLWAKGVAVNSGMDVDISEPDVSPLQVQGPDSKNVLRDLVGPAVLDLGYYYFMRTKIDGIPVVITRTGWTAEVGYEVYLMDGRRGVELWDRIMEAGKKYDIRPIAPSEIRRIEGGILNYGSDMTLENNPYEVGLGWLVDLGKKADFIGKKALTKIKREGVKRKLVGVEIPGPQIHAWATEFWDVTKDGKKVGHLTALTYSPRLEKNIAYAWVPIRLAKLGTRLTIATSAGERDAIVVKKPFVDPKKSIPKSWRANGLGAGSTSLRSEDRSRQAGRSAFGLERNFFPSIGPDATPGGLEALLSDRVPFEDDAIAGRNREHVRRHPVEFLVRDFDEFESAIVEGFPERDREEAWVHHCEVVIDDADERHQMEARLRALEVRQRDGLHFHADALHRLPDLPQALRVRSETLAHRQEVMIHPEEIAALRGRIAVERGENRYAKLLERSGHRFLFTAPKRLSHPEDERSAVGHDGGIVNEDRIRSPRLWVLVISDVDPGLLQQVDEPVVLSLSSNEVGFRGVSPLPRVSSAERRVGTPHQHRAERIRHALASVGPRQAGPRGLERVLPSYRLSPF